MRIKPKPKRSSNNWNCSKSICCFWFRNFNSIHFQVKKLKCCAFLMNPSNFYIKFMHKTFQRTCLAKRFSLEQNKPMKWCVETLRSWYHFCSQRNISMKSILHVYTFYGKKVAFHGTLIYIFFNLLLHSTLHITSHHITLHPIKNIFNDDTYLCVLIMQEQATKQTKWEGKKKKRKKNHSYFLFEELRHARLSAM